MITSEVLEVRHHSLLLDMLSDFIKRVYRRGRDLAGDWTRLSKCLYLLVQAWCVNVFVIRLAI